jgi:hypothetical protein
MMAAFTGALTLATVPRSASQPTAATSQRRRSSSISSTPPPR